MMSNEQALMYLALIQGKYLDGRGEMTGDSINEITALDMAMEAIEKNARRAGVQCDTCAGAHALYLICSVWHKGGPATVSEARYCPICGRAITGRTQE